MNRRPQGAERWVVLDDERAASMATTRLIERGHRKIGFAGGPSDVDMAERRRRGFMTAMRHAGLEVEPSWVVSADYTAEGGAAAVRAFLASDRPTTAIVAADANEGLGVWHALVARGLSVPHDVSLIAIHRLPAEGFRVPSMSCIEMPLRRLGRRAMELVLDTPWDAPIHEVISDELVIVEGDTVARMFGG